MHKHAQRTSSSGWRRLGDSSESADTLSRRKSRLWCAKGPDAISIVDRFVIPVGKTRFTDVNVDRIVLGHSHRVDGEEVAVSRRDAQTVEIHCHGGPIPVAEISQNLCDAGCFERPWTDSVQAEVTDPIQIAARRALAGATTDQAALTLLDQYQGALRREIEATCGLLQKKERSACGLTVCTFRRRLPSRMLTFSSRRTKPIRVPRH